MFQTVIKSLNGHISVKNWDIDKLISLTESWDSGEYEKQGLLVRWTGSVEKGLNWCMLFTWLLAGCVFVAAPPRLLVPAGEGQNEDSDYNNALNSILVYDLTSREWLYSPTKLITATYGCSVVLIPPHLIWSQSKFTTLSSIIFNFIGLTLQLA